MLMGVTFRPPGQPSAYMALNSSKNQESLYLHTSSGLPQQNATTGASAADIWWTVYVQGMPPAPAGNGPFLNFVQTLTSAPKVKDTAPNSSNLNTLYYAIKTGSSGEIKFTYNSTYATSVITDYSSGIPFPLYPNIELVQSPTDGVIYPASIVPTNPGEAALTMFDDPAEYVSDLLPSNTTDSTKLDYALTFVDYIVYTYPDGTIYYLGSTSWTTERAGTLTVKDINNLVNDWSADPINNKDTWSGSFKLDNSDNPNLTSPVPYSEEVNPTSLPIFIQTQ